jgi:hypothetical protein
MTTEGEGANTPLRPPLPENMPIPAEEVDERRSVLFPEVSGIRPRVAPEKWVKDQITGLIMEVPSGTTGKHSVPRPTPRAVSPPQRFRRLSPWQSAAILLVVLILSLLSCIGLLALGSSGASLLHPFLSVTPSPIPSASPTRIPPTRTAEP